MQKLFLFLLGCTVSFVAFAENPAEAFLGSEFCGSVVAFSKCTAKEFFDNGFPAGSSKSWEKLDDEQWALHVSYQDKLTKKSNKANISLSKQGNNVVPNRLVSNGKEMPLTVVIGSDIVNTPSGKLLAQFVWTALKKLGRDKDIQKNLDKNLKDKNSREHEQLLRSAVGIDGKKSSVTVSDLERFFKGIGATITFTDAVTLQAKKNETTYALQFYENGDFNFEKNGDILSSPSAKKTLLDEVTAWKSKKSVNSKLFVAGSKELMTATEAFEQEKASSESAEKEKEIKKAKQQGSEQNELFALASGQFHNRNGKERGQLEVTSSGPDKVSLSYHNEGCFFQKTITLEYTDNVFRTVAKDGQCELTVSFQRNNNLGAYFSLDDSGDCKTLCGGNYQTITGSYVKPAGAQ